MYIKFIIIRENKIMTQILDLIWQNSIKVNTISQYANKAIQIILLQKQVHKNQNQTNLAWSKNINLNKYALHFNINFGRSCTTLKINILKNDGDFIKINDKINRIYLTKKFMTLKKQYLPKVNPYSGHLYFRFDFFQSRRQLILFQSQKQAKRLISSIDLNKIQQIIGKLQLFHNDIIDQQRNYGLHFTDFKYPLEISKCVLLFSQYDADNIITKFDNNLSEVDLQRIQLINIAEINHHFTNRRDNQLKTNNKRIKAYDYNLGQQKLKIQYFTKKQDKGKSNYVNLNTNQLGQQKLQKSLENLLQFNLDYIQLKLQTQQNKQVMISCHNTQQQKFRQYQSALNGLAKHTQYYFIDKYFKRSNTFPFIIRLATKEETLTRFMQKNRMTMSLKSKLRIFLQICTAANIFWQDNKILLNLSNLKNIFVTSNLTIKLRNLHEFCKAQPHMIKQQKILVNEKILCSLLQISNLYFYIFFNHPLIYQRPISQKQINNVLNDYFCQRIDSFTVSHLLPSAINGPIKNVIVSLNYIFVSLVERAQKFKEYKFNPESSHSFQQQQIFNFKYISCWVYKIYQKLIQQETT